ncbi:LysR family transcriptional regulator [Nereida sp. MMG025]|uniref:LysR family transcriptional regulator n=1 Tax=Nereida sp. MMG025 TaxID=2909981 RepID=UPI001F16DFFD|nr:LysR family transcriptional regulator [Nereida sp. MMG025]MCF6443845.1 LysR family transcriptional regulator [Nereida sp. MMG025]
MATSQDRFTLWGIEVFLATVEERSISAAARRLGTSPATVSQQLTNLETAIGTTLLDRSQRPIMATPAGDTFRVRAQNIVNEATQARSELALDGQTTLTSFRLGMIEDLDADVTPRLLSDMAEKLEGCQFLLETGASHRLFDLLDARALDMIVAADMGAAADWTDVYPLLSDPFIVAVPKGEPVDALSLSQRPLIQYTQRHHMGRQITAHLARQRIPFIRQFELDSYHSILAMVAAGQGWAILSALGWMRAGRFRDQVDIAPLPFGKLGRTISLNARKDVLRDMPGETADALRAILAEMIVRPAVAETPWLSNALRVER